MNNTNSSYQETFTALQNVLSSLERESSSIDELSENLNRGFSLLEELKSRLSATEARVEAVISARTESKNTNSTTQDETD
jgi:exodeoxyribonuclease VII small subunit